MFQFSKQNWSRSFQVFEVPNYFEGWKQLFDKLELIILFRTRKKVLVLPLGIVNQSTVCMFLVL